MKKKISCVDRANSIISLIKFKNSDIYSLVKMVTVYKGGEIILSDKEITVDVKDCNILYQLDIAWEDVISAEDFERMGLYRRYSSDYHKIQYHKNQLIIFNGNDVIVKITV